MRKKTLLLTGVICFIGLPVSADNIRDFPDRFGQVPCSMFVIERVIDGNVFTAHPEQSGITLATFSNNSVNDGTMVEVAGDLYETLLIEVTTDGLKCTGIPLDETHAATGS